tara:strand:+ start:735 stop:1646 length:912 start_codon:yes stop_codon:yes gene_type:complete
MAQKIIPEAQSRARLLSFIREYREKAGTEAGGSDTQVQFNDGGAFGGSAGLTFVTANESLQVGRPSTPNGYIQVYNDGGDPLVNVENGGNQHPSSIFAVVSGAAGPGNQPGRVGIGTALPIALLNISSSYAGSLFRIDVEEDENPVISVSGSSDVGVNTATPKIRLDVNHGLLDWLDADTGGGDFVQFGGGTTVAGKLYYLHSGSSAWELTDADLETSGSRQMLAIALGTSPTDGMLLRGFFSMDTYLVGTPKPGSPVYVSTTTGQADMTSPFGAGDFVRVIGFCTTETNVIYFNPQPTFKAV